MRDKRPRIKLTTMQRERQAGGLSLPNFRFYKWAFPQRPVLSWFHPEVQVSSKEERLLASYSFTSILHSNISIHHCNSRYGPIILYLQFIWRNAKKVAGCSSGVACIFQYLIAVDWWSLYSLSHLGK